jgi:colanic acid/amylovoran biosynthesis protein
VKLLLVNQSSAVNIGDRAIHAETLRMLEQALPGAEIALTFHEPDEARRVFPSYAIHESLDSWAYRIDPSGRPVIAPVHERLADLLRLALGALAYRATGSVPRLFARRDKQALFEAFAAADMVLACGGGYFYDTVTPTGRLARLVSFFSWSIFLLGGFLLPLALGKPLVLLPQSIGPLRDGLRRAAAQLIARRALITIVRERESLRLLEELRCAERAICAPDMAFGMASAPAHQARELLREAGLWRIDAAFRVGVTALDWGGQDRTFAGQARYERALLACIDAIADEGGVVVLFNQCGGAAEEWDDARLNLRLRAAARRPERVLVVNDLLPPELLQAAYGHMDYFVGTRMHSVILALNAGVPALAIGYLHKSQGIMRELGQSDRCLDIAAVTGTALIEAFARLRAEGVRPSSGEYVARARRFKRALGQILRALIERNTKVVLRRNSAS